MAAIFLGGNVGSVARGCVVYRVAGRAGIRDVAARAAETRWIARGPGSAAIEGCYEVFLSDWSPRIRR